MSVVVVREPSALTNYIEDWQDLAEHALEPNVFYEPWFLVPAIKAFADGLDLEFVLMFAPNPVNGLAPRILCGFFPLERKRSYKGLPVSAFTLWKHIHCYLCTPLLRTGYARECLSAFFDWLVVGDHSCPLMEFGLIKADGPFHQLLVDYCNKSTKLTYVTECFTRALFRPAEDAERYVAAAVSAKHRRTLRSQESRLARSGPLSYVTLGPDTDARRWIEQFLQLEASGWKGQEGSALASNEAGRSFFLAAAMAAFCRGRLMMLALHFNGQPIAYKCNFLAGPGSFAFKIAFDEEYARFSPGVLLELENIRQLHARPEIRWMDSCAEPDHFMKNWLWLDRHMISTVLLGTGRWPGDLAVSLIPLLRWLNRKFSPRKSN